MKVSVITICYNNECDIRKTIESVINQSHPDIEYIIKDGGSMDNTLAIVNEYKDKIAKIVSCRDKGIYDALNQGIEVATGDVVGFIHSGDMLYDCDVISRISKFHEETNADISYGGSVNINENGKIVRLNRSPRKLSRLWIRLGWMPSHMSMYCKRELFDKYGMYRLDMPIAGDYEWYLRYFYKYGREFNIQGMEGFTLFFQLGGVSSQDGFNKFSKKQKQMLADCWTVNGLKPIPGLVYVRPWWVIRNIIQYIWEAKILGRKSFK